MNDEEKVFDVAPEEVYEDNRSRITIFFHIRRKKFWKLIQFSNLFGFNIQLIVISYFLSGYLISPLTPAVEVSADIIVLMFVYGFSDDAADVNTSSCCGTVTGRINLSFTLFSYRDPTFYWSDFKDKIKENCKV